MKRMTLLLAALAIVITAFAQGPITEQPAGLFKNYERAGQCVINQYDYGFYVAYQEGKVGVVYADDGKVYMKNPLLAMSYDTWVEGYINEDDGTIRIPMGQVLYHSEYYDADVILSWGSTSEGMINWDTYEVEVNYTPDETVTEAIFRIDGDKLYLENSQGAEVLTAEDLAEFQATGLSAIWADNHAWVQTIEWGTILTELPPVLPAVPANPEVIEWRDMGNENGWNRLEFNINPVDVDGNPLDVEQGQLTYSVFTDNDQIFTFDSYHYGYDFNYQDVTEVPYDQYSYNFSPNSIFFYRTNAEGYDRFFEWRIGMQVYYTVDGVRNASDIVYLEVFPEPHTGINEANEAKAVAGVRYYNMAGQEVAQPNGMTIQVTTYTDGTTSTAKVVK